MSSKKEMAANAARWATVAKNELPPDMGFIMIFFPKDAIGGASGACISNVNNEGTKDQLKATLKRYGEQSVIWTPGSN